MITIAEGGDKINGKGFPLEVCVVVYTYLLFVASRTLEPALATSRAWQIVLRTADPRILLADIAFPLGWWIDIDPVSLLWNLLKE
jgi:hypothetical protein